MFMVKAFDIFGEAVTFNIRGKEQIRTLMGAFMSICILGLTFSYAISRFDEMSNYRDSTYMQYVEPDVNADEYFS